MEKAPGYLLILALLSPIIGLGLVFASIAISPWFNLWENALSDLGKMGRPSAAIFNLGLASSGFLMSSTLLISCLDNKRKIVLFLTGDFLVLVGVYNESYGSIHFIVSVLFFIGLMTYLFTTGIYDRSILRIIIGLSHMAVWIAYFAAGIPSGAAIPELYAVTTFLCFYTKDIFCKQSS